MGFFDSFGGGGDSSDSGSSSNDKSSDGGWFSGVSDAVDSVADSVGLGGDSSSSSSGGSSSSESAGSGSSTQGSSGGAASAISSFVGSSVDTVTDTASDVADSVESGASDLGHTAEDTAGSVAHDVERSLDNAANSAGSAVDDFVPGSSGGSSSGSGKSPSSSASSSSSSGSSRSSGSPSPTVGNGPVSAIDATATGAPEVGPESPVDTSAPSLGEQSAEKVTPGIGLVASDEGLKARAKRERTFAKRSDQGLKDLSNGQLPNASEAGAMWFQGAENVDRWLQHAGRNIKDASPTQGMGPEFGDEHVGDIPGNLAAAVPETAGITAGAIGQYPVTAAADLTGDATANGETPTEASGGVGNLLATGAENQIDVMARHPGSTALGFALPAAETGSGFFRGVRSGADTTVPYEAISDASGSRGGVSRFDTGTGEPTRTAVDELRGKAADQPSEVLDAAGSDAVTYHTTSDSLGSDLSVTEGSSELSGLWTAPDANSVGLRNTDFGTAARDTLSRLKPSKPDLSTTPDRVAAFPGDEISGMPDWAQGAGYEVRTGDGSVVERGLGRGEAKALAEKQGGDSFVAPDQTTSGYEFLTEDAKPGEAYVRPKGSRTPEQEAIFPPDSQFQQINPDQSVNVAIGSREITIPESVNLGGRQVSVPGGGRTMFLGGERVPMDFYGRAERAGRGASESAGKTSRTSATDLSRDYTPVEEAGGSQGLTASSYGAAAAAGLTSSIIDSASSTADLPGTSITEPPVSEPPSLPPTSEPPSSWPDPTTPEPTLPASEPPSGWPMDEPSRMSPSGSSTEPTPRPSSQPPASDGDYRPYWDESSDSGSRRRRDRGDDADQLDQGFFAGYFAKDWVNPVASAQEALDSTLASGEASTATFDETMASADRALEDSLAGVNENLDEVLRGGRR